MKMVPGGPQSDLAPDEAATVRLFQAATPSVVNIANIQTRQSYAMDAVNVPVGTGSGFVWDVKGHIVTNYHVVRGANAIKVALIDSSVYDATFIAGDADKDVAVLQLVAPPDVLRSLKPVSRWSGEGGVGVDWCLFVSTAPQLTHTVEWRGGGGGGGICLFSLSHRPSPHTHHPPHRSPWATPPTCKSARKCTPSATRLGWTTLCRVASSRASGASWQPPALSVFPLRMLFKPMPASTRVRTRVWE